MTVQRFQVSKVLKFGGAAKESGIHPPSGPFQVHSKELNSHMAYVAALTIRPTSAITALAA
jgi:hypothetical protein